MYGGVARVAPEMEGRVTSTTDARGGTTTEERSHGWPCTLSRVAQVVEWRQVQEYAALTDFVWLRRINLVLDNPKKEAGKGMCPCHQV